jgi:hypothetical protein
LDKKYKAQHYPKIAQSCALLNKKILPEKFGGKRCECLVKKRLNFYVQFWAIWAIKISPNNKNFAQSGHPGGECRSHTPRRRGSTG